MSTTLATTMPSPIPLLRALLTSSQIRCASNWMPREKYAKIKAIDKLHRKQKEAIRNERLESRIRAKSMQPPPYEAKVPQNASSEVRAAADALSSVSLSPRSLSSPPASSPDLPYSMARAGPSRNFPVYESAKSGGTKHITTLRKLSGDLELMKTHLCQTLGLEQRVIDRRGRKRDNVTINHRTNHIVIRGWRGPEVKRWAEMVGF